MASRGATDRDVVCFDPDGRSVGPPVERVVRRSTILEVWGTVDYRR
jgi:hypothetical protein